MTAQEKCRLILNKYPETKFNRAEFFWKYLEEFHDVKIYILKEQFYGFWRDFAGVERSLRDVLKEEAYKLPPEADQKRYQKEVEFVNNLKGKVG